MIGNKVRLKSSSSWKYQGIDNNGEEMHGVVVESISVDKDTDVLPFEKKWYKVRWSNGSENEYPKEDLIIIKQIKYKRKRLC